MNETQFADVSANLMFGCNANSLRGQEPHRRWEWSPQWGYEDAMTWMQWLTFHGCVIEICGSTSDDKILFVDITELHHGTTTAYGEAKGYGLLFTLTAASVAFLNNNPYLLGDRED